MVQRMPSLLRNAGNFQSAVFLPLLYTTIASLGLIMSIWRQADINIDRRQIVTNDQQYDFIIVGAGSAGCLLANRLSLHYNVLLLEAGGEPHPLQSIPGFTIFLINYPEVDWGHLTVPQKHASLNSINQRSSYSAGRGLGGTSSLNIMLHLRGNPRDYDSWANITQDPTWSYEALVPYFRKYEKYGNPNGDPRYHGFDGELNVEVPDFTGIADEFLEAGRELGYPEIDINARHGEGFFKLYHTIEDGIRDSSYRAFLKPARKRKSLTIRKYALVTKVLFKDGNREVYGVEYERHNKVERATASKEVIISAGAITSPKLLMLSGIGPAEHLRSLNIPVRHNLPVGKNLQDHVSVYFGPIYIDPPKSTFLDRDITPGAFVNWFTTGGGPLGSSGAHASAVFSSEFAKARGEGNWPDIQLFMFGYSVHSTFAETFSKSFGLKADELRKYYAPSVGRESVLVAISGARPYSRGDIRLGGSSAHDPPAIDPNFLSDENDLDLRVLLEGVKATLHIFENTTTMNRIGARFTTTRLPGCEHLPFRSDAYWICYIRRYTVTLHHACGTASMGPRGSPSGVVDSELRVQGVRNLRVIDASVMPLIPVTNIQAGTYLVAEKGADMILRYWGTPARVTH